MARYNACEVVIQVVFLIKQYLKMAIQNIYLPLVYEVCRLVHREINPKLALFADARVDTIPSDMSAVYDKMTAEGFEVKTFFMDIRKRPLLTILLRMTTFMNWYARAKYVFIRDSYVPVSSGKKRRETTVIQLCHFCGAFKKFGYSTDDDVPKYYIGNAFRNYDIVTVSSPFCAAFFAEALRCPVENVFSTGIARTDKYFVPGYIDSCRSKFNALYPELTGKKIVLWAPTFRGKASDPYALGRDAIARLREKLGEGYAVLERLHPHLNAKEKKEHEMPTDELLPVTDILITDYSSILFDYLLFLKPFVLFAPDYEEYKNTRGFYIDYLTDIPARVVIDPDELPETALTCGETFDPVKTRAFRELHMSACDGNATERIWETLKRR